ncbi:MULTISPECIES: N-6 DNA methylase [unclassified Haloferax]|uniref:N-6 DNA methylase n=1 Tax=unclassified Haloferax TaxID=2625095 RepID=UPI002875EB94|nr:MULTISPECIES: N-6 DNA methylase [unclassified Haloferax]MDS0243086.1 SAM-dependent methyltransferase [Haloferax sp. S2CR25]MDS0446207.1 SAM-dependent methyltransferase [Haloferax sp. S2CR25-2]
MEETDDSPLDSVPSSVDVSPITNRLEGVTHQTGLSRYRAFQQWIDLMLASFSRDDDRHQAILKDVADLANDPRAIFETYAECLGELVMLSEEHMHDVLGQVYEEFGMSSDNFGQYFTPYPAAELLAGIGGVPGDGEKVCDDSCGSGRLLIAAYRQAVREPGRRRYFAKDKDPMCAKMTAINFALFNIDGYVELGDSIKMTTQRAWETGMRMDGTVIRELDLDEDGEKRPDDDVFEQSSIGTFA